MYIRYIEFNEMQLHGNRLVQDEYIMCYSLYARCVLASIHVETSIVFSSIAFKSHDERVTSAYRI